jgi:hypothetical protein
MSHGVRPSKPSPRQEEAVRRGMWLVGGYFAAYFGIGFVYPFLNADGDTMLRSIQRKLGWIEDRDGTPLDCTSIVSEGSNPKPPSSADKK